MTAINVLITENAAHVLTDGLCAAPGLGPIAVPKVIPLPHLRMAVATRGPAELLQVMLPIISAAPSFKDLVEFFRNDFRALTKLQHPNWPAGIFKRDFDIVIAGWSKSGPAAFLITSSVGHGIPTWEPFFFGNFLCTPKVSDDAFEAFHASPDPLRDFIGVLDYQAAREPAVGGFAQLTTITSDEISTRILKRYPPKEIVRASAFQSASRPIELSGALKKAIAKL
ncbi:hypothetical protein [Mesorhizobium sp. DCY119]|uniref:hypothetical protein n=1 Tax=Mesorhizobium sp. DCY119 TaxID=2108445 RepID=UPI000E6BF306|nr:hypothetical protein [Mesorhizobium sp. DCY119]